MKVLVTGAKGMLGEDLCPMLEDFGFEVLETDRDSLDITDEMAVFRFFKEEKPDFVVHCAAFTDVDGAEKESELAEKINVKGAENVAKAAENVDAGIVYISTDYVFSGEKTGMYLPADRTSPVNKYGKTKLDGERAVRKLCKRHYIIRTSWLYGHYGKNFVETMIALKDKKEIKVVEDQVGCPTWTVVLSERIAEMIDAGEDEYPYGTYQICSSDATTWYEFAKEIFRLVGAEVKVVSCTSAEFEREAKRPKNSAMKTCLETPCWKDSLKEYIELRCE